MWLKLMAAPIPDLQSLHDLRLNHILQKYTRLSLTTLLCV